MVDSKTEQANVMVSFQRVSMRRSNESLTAKSRRADAERMCVCVCVCSRGQRWREPKESVGPERQERGMIGYIALAVNRRKWYPLPASGTVSENTGKMGELG